MKPGTNNSGCKGGQFGLERVTDGVGKPCRSLQHDVDDERATDQFQLRALTFQVRDRLANLRSCAVANSRTVVEHPVDGGLTQARLLSDLPHFESMRHNYLTMMDI